MNLIDPFQLLALFPSFSYIPQNGLILININFSLKLFDDDSLTHKLAGGLFEDHLAKKVKILLLSDYFFVKSTDF